MKALRNIFFLVMIGLISLAKKCPEEDEPAVDDLQATLDLFQKKDWKVTGVFKDGADITEFWGTNFIVNFGEASDPDNSNKVVDMYGDFSTSGHDSELVPEALFIWPESGGWGRMSKDDNDVITFLRISDQNILMFEEQEITIDEVEATTLKLSFVVSDPNARSNGIYEELWEFEFSN